jgi:hypothetical protein
MDQHHRDHLQRKARTGSSSRLQSQPSLEPAIFFIVGPINCGRRRRCRTHFTSSCALQYHGVFVLQAVKLHGITEWPCKEDQVLRVAADLDIHLASAGRRGALSFLRELAALQTCSPSSRLPTAESSPGLVVSPPRYYARATCSLAIPAECHEKRPGPALSGVRHDAESAWS